MKIYKCTHLIPVLCILCNLTSQNVFCQTQKFSPGYYLNKAEDTVRGFIMLKGKQNKISFLYKQSESEKDSQEINFDTCKTVSVKNTMYVNWYGKRNMSYVEHFTYDLINLDSFRIEKIPLKLIFKGNPFSLYYYEDQSKHFFIEENNTITELLYVPRRLTEQEKFSYRHMRNSPTYFMMPIYKSQLTDLAKNKLSFHQKYLLDVTEYEKTSMVRLIKSLNHVK